MKESARWIALSITIALVVFVTVWVIKWPITRTVSESQLKELPSAVAIPGDEPNDGSQEALAKFGIGPDFRFDEWKNEKRVSVSFLNPPSIDTEGLVCVMNPEYEFEGLRLTEFVEDGVWYYQTLAGTRGAILFGRGNGRPPWCYLVGELHIESGELQLRHRICFGGNKGARTRLLLDMSEETVITKIGIAVGEIVQGSPWGYPAITADEIVISPEEVEETPRVRIRPNWIQLGIDFKPVETFREPVRVIWLQFQDGGRKIARIENR